MKKFITTRLAPFLLGRRVFSRVNRIIVTIGLRGLGIGNWLDSRSERLFLKRLARVLPSQGTILDVGANDGAYISMIRQYFPQARLLAFEPHPRNFARLASVAVDQNFEAINSACGEMQAKATLYDYPEGCGSRHASLTREAIEEAHSDRSKGQSQGFEIEVVTLDSVFAERNLKVVDFLKIDVEGHEMAVLRGARKSVAGGRIRIIQFEFTELNIYSRTFLRDFKELLIDYRIFRILYNGDLIDISDSPPLFSELFFYQNLVAIHRDDSEVLTEFAIAQDA